MKGDLSGKLMELELAQQQAKTDLSTKLEVHVFVTKNEDHRREKVQGLASLEELQSWVNTSSRHMEELSSKVSTEIAKCTYFYEDKMDEFKVFCDKSLTSMAMLQSSIEKIESNYENIRNLNTRMETVDKHINTLESGRLTTNDLKYTE